MAIDKRLKIYDEQGNEVDYDILATDVKFSDGKDLPTKLDELEDEIGEGGYTPPAGGIPKTDLASDVQASLDKADTAVQDPNYVHTSNDYTTAEQTKLAGLPTGSELNTALGNKANNADVYTKAQADAAIQEAVEDVPTGKSAYDIAVEEGFVGDEAAWLASLKGEKGDQGDTVVLDTEGLPLFKVINDLVTGGGEDALSAEMGVVIRREVNSLFDSVNRLYGKLAAMAFWSAEDQADAAPTPMNWNLPKVTVSITNSIGDGAVIKRNGSVVSGSLQLDKGDELVLTVEALNEDYELSSLTVTVDGVAATLVNGTLTIEHVNANTAIEFSGTSTQVWFTANKSNMVVGRTINSQNGLETDGLYNGPNGLQAEVVMSPKGPNSVAGNNSVSPGNAPQHFHDVGGATKITLKFIDPRVTTPNAQDGLSYQAEIAQYTSSYGFISRGGYVWVPATQPEVGGLCNAEFSLASNAKYVKILFFQRVRVTAEHIDANTYFSSLPSDFLKYKLD